MLLLLAGTTSTSATAAPHAVAKATVAVGWVLLLFRLHLLEVTTRVEILMMVFGITLGMVLLTHDHHGQKKPMLAVRHQAEVGLKDEDSRQEL